MTTWRPLTLDEIFEQAVWTEIPHQRQKPGRGPGRVFRGGQLHLPKRPAKPALHEDSDALGYNFLGTPRTEANALIPLARNVGVDEVRELIRVSDTDRHELKNTWPHCITAIVEFRDEVLREFDKLIAEGRLERKPPQGIPANVAAD
jgi:hypothetical protein